MPLIAKSILTILMLKEETFADIAFMALFQRRHFHLRINKAKYGKNPKRVSPRKFSPQNLTNICMCIVAMLRTVLNFVNLLKLYILLKNIKYSQLNTNNRALLSTLL